MFRYLCPFCSLMTFCFVRAQELEHDRVQLEGKLKYAESMSEELRTEIITFRKNYDELTADVDKTKVSQLYISSVSFRLIFIGSRP